MTLDAQDILAEACADWVRDEPGTPSTSKAAPRVRPPVDLDVLGVLPVDWAALWATEPIGEDWAVEPILPRGRQGGLFAPAGLGKSLIACDIAAAKACGRSVLGQPAKAPVSVVYLDLEMTAEDLRERLLDFGYGPEDDLSMLHYYQLPTLPPLDTVGGGDVLMAICERYRPELVVIDTMARVVEGDENNADTYRAFYRCTGSRLKAAGIALLRLDHSGKDIARGQRGSSSKADDLDLIWRMSLAEDQIILTRTKSRVSYVAAEVALTRVTEPVLRHVLAPVGVPAGTASTADLLDRLEVALDASSAVAAAALTRHGSGRRKAVVLAALKYRRSRQAGSGAPSDRFPKTGNRPSRTPADDTGTTTEPVARALAAVQVTTPEQFPEPVGTAEPFTGSRFPLRSREPDRNHPPEDDSEPCWESE